MGCFYSCTEFSNRQQACFVLLGAQTEFGCTDVYEIFWPFGICMCSLVILEVRNYKRKFRFFVFVDG
jgi:hypothetical protein